MPVTAPAERPRTGSKRLRRVTWTASTFVVLVLIAALVTWRIRKENAPEEYTPGEASKDITSTLSGPATQATPVPLQAVKNTVSSRAVDRLVDPGRNLPPGAPEPRFTDVTKAAGLASFRQFEGARTSQLPEDMGSLSLIHIF